METLTIWDEYSTLMGEAVPEQPDTGITGKFRYRDPRAFANKVNKRRAANKAARKARKR